MLCSGVEEHVCNARVAKRTRTRTADLSPGSHERARPPQPVRHPVDRLSPLSVARPTFIISASPAMHPLAPAHTLGQLKALHGGLIDHLVVGHTGEYRGAV